MANTDAPKGVDADLYAKINKIYGKRGHQSDLQKRRAVDLEQRIAASTILAPEDVKGDYDVTRMLNTTLGGKKRSITSKDLVAFKRNIATAKTRYNGGITPQKVINLSMDADIERSRAQIRTAVFSRRDPNGNAYFVTNASHDPSKPDKPKHHTVHIIFKQFGEAMVTAGNTPDLVKHFMSNGLIAYDCTCERHRYWFRYITTIGDFYAGRPETGFPKVTNPNLSGVACKHVICVMNRIQQMAMRNQFASWLRAARASQDSQSVQASAAEMKAAAIKQAQTSHHKRNQVQRKEDVLIFKALQQAKALPVDHQKAMENLKQFYDDGIINKTAYNTGLKRINKMFGVK